MSFERAVAIVMDYEGRFYENDPNDPGGETKFGICKKSYPDEDIRGLTEDRAVEIYRRDFWNPICGDHLPDSLAMVVFDCAVNQGVNVAVRILQGVLGGTVETDGKMGPVTLAAALAADENAAYMYLLHRARRYMTTRNVQFFGNNWGTRLIELAEAVSKNKGEKK